MGFLTPMRGLTELALTETDPTAAVGKSAMLSISHENNLG